MDEAKIYIYGIIDAWQDANANEYGYVNLKSVKDQYDKQKDSKTITLHIHSEGGVVTEGFAIYNYLRSLKKPITAKIDGVCASIATVILLAGDTRIGSEHASPLIHNPWGMIGGESKDVKKYADELEKMENEIADFYAKKTNLTKDEALELMKVETTFTADEALSKGFLTQIETVMRAVALYNPKKNKKMSKKELSKKEATNVVNKLIDAIASIGTGKKKGNKAKAENKIVQDANGDELDFYELEDTDAVTTGSKAKVDNNDASGEYVMPSGETYVFGEKGELMEIKPADDEDSDDAEAIENLQTELDEANTTITNLKAKNKKLKDTNKAMKSQFKGFEKDLKNVQNALGSNFRHKGKKKNFKNTDGESRQVFKKEPTV